MSDKVFKDEYNLKKVKKISVESFQMFITPRYYEHYVKKQFEPYSSEIVKNHLKSDSTFVDVGAHYGYYSLLAYHSCSNIKIIAIEPVSKSFEILKKNISINLIEKSELYNFAASDVTGFRDFNITEASDSASFYDHPLTRTIKRIRIKTVRLDDILKDKKIDFIKIDVEGNEIPVLSGLTETIANNEKILLLIEMNPKLQKKAGFDPCDLLMKIKDLGFESYLIDEKRERCYRLSNNRYSLDRLMDIRSYANIFCVKKKEALYIAYFGHSCETFGAERSLLELLDQTKRYNIISHVVLPYKGSLCKMIKGKGASYDIVPYKQWADRFASVGDYLNSFIKTIRLFTELNKLNPNIICTNTIVIPWGAISAYFLHIPHIWYIREFGREDHGFKFVMVFKNITRFIDLFSDKVVYNSKAVQNYFNSYITKDKGVQIYNNITIQNNIKDEQIEEVFRSKNSLKLITIASTVSVSKGQDQAVKAVMELNKEGHNIELLIIGENSGAYAQSLKRFAEEHGAKGIYFKDCVSNPFYYINKADVVLTCSRREAFGRVTVEGMMLGKPVIGANTGGTVELIKDGYNGFLYNYPEIEDLKDKIKYFIENKEQINVLGNNARNFANSNFNEQKYAQRFICLSKELLNIRKSFLVQMKGFAILCKFLICSMLLIFYWDGDSFKNSQVKRWLIKQWYCRILPVVLFPRNCWRKFLRHK